MLISRIALSALFAATLPSADQAAESFDWTATVACALNVDGAHILSLTNESGVTSVKYLNVSYSAETGDIVRVRGTFIRHGRLYCPTATNITRVGRAPAPLPTPVSIAEIFQDRHNGRFVRIRGVLRDVHMAEDNSRWRTMRLCAPDGSIYVSGPAGRIDSARLETLIGRTVRIDGFPLPADGLGHAFTGHHFQVPDDRAVSPVSDDDRDPFLAPPAEDLQGKNPEFIASSGRRRVRGRVLCTWGGRQALLRTAQLDVVELDLKPGPLPEVGTEIEASGLPVTDMYWLLFDNALWRPAGGFRADAPPEPPSAVTAQKILARDSSGQLTAKTSYQGSLVRMVGLVRKIPDARLGEDTLLLDDAGSLFGVDIGHARRSLADLTEGCTVEVTGICRLETKFWRPGLSVPRIGGFSLVVRGPEDLRIVSRPPWWTPRRLWTAIFVILAILVAVVIWNRLLQHLVERRGHDLYRSQIGKATADLRTEERTRMAIELHDSISQNLTGVSMRIDAAERLVDRKQVRTINLLNIASKTLDSCREELRNCIWDLRNQTIDERDMNEAIRRTVQRHVEGATLTIRFNVPRQKLSDNTMHALLHIVRELATNAVRHGHATEIRIAGVLGSGRLAFSVSDNGCGFDPATRPGVPEGHFGLQGVSERIRAFAGTMEIDSALGKGTRICIRFGS